MRTLIRTLIFILFAYQLNSSFIIFPTKQWALVEEYDRVIETVRKRCKPEQYYLPDSVSLEFGQLKEEIAYCQTRLNGFKLVFDKKYWNEYAQPIDRTQLMMHEVVHCIFNQDHVNDSRHFMSPFFIVIPKDVLYKQFDEYLRARCN